MDGDFFLDILYIDHTIFDELAQLVQNRLCPQLDIQLHQLPNASQYLRILRTQGKQQLSLLMMAASSEYDDIVRVLLSHDNTPNQVELKGTVIASDQLTINGATALYCACYHGHFIVAKTLIELGRANVNQHTNDDPSYPLLLHAAMLNRRDIVAFLLDHKYADVNDTKSFDFTRCTALTLAAFEGHVSLIEYLIANGADVNYSCEHPDLINPTPLICALLGGHIDAVQVLLHATADTSNLKEDEGDLVATAIAGKNLSIIDFLLTQSITTVEQIELAVCSCIHIHTPVEQMREILEFLEFALRWRARSILPKVCIEPIAIYDYHRECQTLDELDSIKDDPHRIFIETLLIRERIALSRNDISIVKPLHSYGDSLVRRRQFEKCLNVWIHMFYLYQRMNMNTILHRFVWLFCQMMIENEPIPVGWFLQVGRLVFESSHLQEKNNTVHNVIFLIIIATKILEQEGLTQSDRTSIYSWVKDVCRLQLATADGRTLVHICVDAKTDRAISFRCEDICPHIQFPDESALRLMLACGSRWLDLDAVEHSRGNTPLHLLCMNSNYPEIVELLVKSGCHTDSVNKYGRTPFDYIDDLELKTLYSSKSIPSKLKCLCARFIVKEQLNINCLNALTSTLSKFVVLHGYHSIKP